MLLFCLFVDLIYKLLVQKYLGVIRSGGEEMFKVEGEAEEIDHDHHSLQCLQHWRQVVKQGWNLEAVGRV